MSLNSGPIRSPVRSKMRLDPRRDDQKADMGSDETRSDSPIFHETQQVQIMKIFNNYLETCKTLTNSKFSI